MGFKKVFGLVDETPEEGSVSPPGGPDPETVREKIRRPRKASLAEQAEERREAALLEDLYADENWEEIASLYFNVRYGMTGWDGFLLSDKQKSVLTSSTAALMRTLIRIDPRYVALIIFSVNFGSILAQKEMSYHAILKAQAEAAKGNGA